MREEGFAGGKRKKDYLKKITKMSKNSKTIAYFRKCCQKKNLKGCWLCEEFETCKKLQGDLCKVHGDGHLKNLRKIRKKGEEKFLKGKKDW